MFNEVKDMINTNPVRFLECEITEIKSIPEFLEIHILHATNFNIPLEELFASKTINPLAGKVVYLQTCSQIRIFRAQFSDSLTKKNIWNSAYFFLF
jgi:hypothetical protein